MKNVYLYKTSIGNVVIGENGFGVTQICFGDRIPKDAEFIETPLLKKANEELQEYFSGKRKVFDLPLVMEGTEFQKMVWKALSEIPYGTTCSYKDIALKIGNEKASRAVGMANNKNPIPIIVPCHRVVGTNGKLVGYAGGLDVKQKLLEIEKGK
ncbi:methylated-DNA/protein-cysteine methyltransferase [Clostridium sp. DL-VIII]|uniref:methylated-DNA--[protein]-cysteine S-methyltransferase n=1 Tax=Clostridium sp. DL-VIII TaxID=641107 RepID=UPI00023AFE2E|nr:methylated-DNA--[protein]-cysteine S-methyltransferase [Clostridium sp. DL-VIII]EHJ00261.1 methylated-DNA/protein-cysteine methyltransferase [Clostridium sp. DL-VIII]